MLDARKIVFNQLTTQPIVEDSHTRNLCHLYGEVDLYKHPEKWLVQVGTFRRRTTLLEKRADDFLRLENAGITDEWYEED